MSYDNGLSTKHVFEQHPTRADWSRAFRATARERIIARITTAFQCEDSEFSTNKAESEQVMADMRECLTWVQSTRQHR
jgi:hypothetical protein